MQRQLFILLVLFFSQALKAQTFTGTGGGIPDAGPQICFPITVSGVGNIDANFGLASICFSINHTFTSDLEIILKAPDGTAVQLSIGNGGAGVNYTGTCFTANATIPITSAIAPFTGTFLPQGYLGNINNGEDADGIWNLCIQDKNAKDVGSLINWSLTFNDTPAPPPPGCTGNPPAGNTCATATPVCNFNGFCGNTSSTYTADTWPELTSAFCGIIENNSFISFTASSSTVSFNVWVTNSLKGNGIEMMIFGGGCGSGPVTKYACNPEIIPTITGPTLLNTTGLTPGNIYYIMIDGKNADVCDYTLVAASGIGTLSIVQSKPAICQGQNMVLTASGGNGVYSWSPGNGLSAVSGASVTARPDTTTVYSITSSPLGNCMLTSEVTVKVNPKPDLGPDQIVRICPSGTVNLTTKFKTAGLTSKWTLAGVPVANPAAVSSSGTYRLIATSNSGCSDTALLTVTVNLKPDIGLDKLINVCQGSTADITKEFVTTGLIQNWTFGGLPVANPADVYAAGAYQLIASDGTAGSTCADTALLTLVQLTRPDLGANKSLAICPGEIVTLSVQFPVTGLSSSWSVNGTPYSSGIAFNAGVYQLSATDMSGCADTVLFTLAVNLRPYLGSNKDIHICSGLPVDLTALYNTTGLTSSWTAGGLPLTDSTTVTAGGVYQLIATNPSGCSAGVTVTITPDPKLNLGPDKIINLCPGEAADLTAQYGTNGLSTLWTLNANPVIKPDYVNTDGDYRLIADNGAGCIDTAFLKVINYPNPNLGLDKTVEICNNISFNLNTVYDTTGLITRWTTVGINVIDPSAVTTPGLYSVAGTSIYGCADTANVILKINPNLVLGNDTTVSFCPGGNIDLTSLYGVFFSNKWSIGAIPVSTPTNINTPGIYQLVASYSTGCSDTALVTVLVNSKPALGADKAITFCPGSSLGLTAQYNTAALTDEWSIAGVPVSNPLSIISSGVYRLIAINNSGCTDTAFVSVTIKPKPDLGSDKKIPLCSVDNVNLSAEYDSTGLVTDWTLDGVNVPTPASVNVEGVYQLVSTNNSGCSDTALVSVILSPKPALGTDKKSVDICSNTTLNLMTQFDTTGLLINWTYKGILVPKPEAVTTTGQFRLVATNIYGCHDTSFVEVSVKPVSSSITKVGVCSNQVPYKWNNKDYFASGIYSVILLNSVGCDSITTLELTVLGTSASTTKISICSKQLPYVWNGNNYAVTGIYKTTFVNNAGCDSVATLELTVNTASSSATSVAVCSNQLPYSWNGNSYSSTGTYTKTLINAAACDSIATLQLIVNDTSASTTKISICANQLPYVWNGNDYTTTGNYTIAFINAAGCDSIATLQLMVNLTSTSTTYVTVCPGQLPYMWNGNNYSAAGNYQVTLLNTAGCDSLTLLKLIVNSNTSSTTSVSICYSQLPYLWNGNSYSSANSYKILLVNAAGCDSVAVLDLKVNTASSSINKVALCSNQIPYNWNGKNYSSAGTYDIVLVNAAGCDSIATLILSVSQTTASKTNIKICPGQLPYTWNGNSYESAGTYHVILQNAAGCDSVAALQLTVNANSTSNSEKSICDDELPYSWNGIYCDRAGTYTVVFNNAAGCDSIASLKFTIYTIPKKPFLGNDTAICPGDKIILNAGVYDYYLWNDNSSSPFFTVTSPGIYSVKVGQDIACVNTAIISITSLDNCDDIYFPNAFAPNGINKMFGPAGNIFLVKNYTLQVYNRYGKLVFSSNNPYEKWDGGYQGKQSGTGSYVWRSSYFYKGKYKKSKQGYVVLVR